MTWSLLMKSIIQDRIKKIYRKNYLYLYYIYMANPTYNVNVNLNHLLNDLNTRAIFYANMEWKNIGSGLSYVNQDILRPLIIAAINMATLPATLNPPYQATWSITEAKQYLDFGISPGPPAPPVASYSETNTLQQFSLDITTGAVKFISNSFKNAQNETYPNNTNLLSVYNNCFTNSNGVILIDEPYLASYTITQALTYITTPLSSPPITIPSLVPITPSTQTPPTVPSAGTTLSNTLYLGSLVTIDSTNNVVNFNNASLKGLGPAIENGDAATLKQLNDVQAQLQTGITNCASQLDTILGGNEAYKTFQDIVAFATSLSATDDVNLINAVANLNTQISTETTRAQGVEQTINDTLTQYGVSFTTQNLVVETISLDPNSTSTEIAIENSLYFSGTNSLIDVNDISCQSISSATGSTSVLLNSSINANSNSITNLAAPVDDGDATSKVFVTNAVATETQARQAADALGVAQLTVLMGQLSTLYKSLFHTNLTSNPLPSYQFQVINNGDVQYYATGSDGSIMTQVVLVQNSFLSDSNLHDIKYSLITAPTLPESTYITDFRLDFSNPSSSDRCIYCTLSKPINTSAESGTYTIHFV